MKTNQNITLQLPEGVLTQQAKEQIINKAIDAGCDCGNIHFEVYARMKTTLPLDQLPEGSKQSVRVSLPDGKMSPEQRDKLLELGRQNGLDEQNSKTTVWVKLAFDDQADNQLDDDDQTANGEPIEFTDQEMPAASEIMSQAKASLKGRWGEAILMMFIYLIIVIVASLIPGVSMIAFLATIPLGYGIAICFLKYARNQDVEAGNIFDGFKNYGNVLTTGLIQGIFTFLWMLLLIVPGIIKAYSYSMTFFIMEDTGMTNIEAIDASMEMMRGHKMELFIMDLYFIGMTLLALIFTLGIGILWVQPYWYTARAKFYLELRRRAI